MMEVSANPNQWRLSLDPKTEKAMKMRMNLNKKLEKVKPGRI